MSDSRGDRRWPVILCFVAALMLAIAPMPDWAVPFRPDWVTLTLIYWVMILPHTYSVGSAWLIGLILDVAQGTLLGQHALALSLVAYVTVKFHLQLRVFPVSQMTATVFALLALYQFILFWINGVAGINAAAVTYWGPVISGAIIWPVLAMFYGSVRYRVRG
ncbi:MAG: rod shape-determining protein MreD [Gammaproteobacteria bacterium]|nr:rod shape-determining protein MreD [Gammaproteobacteria bacterium]